MLWRKADETTALALDQLKEPRTDSRSSFKQRRAHRKRAFEQAGLTSYFDFFIDSFIVGVEKPDPAIFQLAI